MLPVRRLLAGVGLVALASCGHRAPTPGAVGTGGAGLRGATYVVFVDRDRRPPRLMARNLVGGDAVPLYTASGASDLDCALSPRGRQLAVVEWDASRPGWSRFYWAHVSVIDLQTGKVRLLLGEDQFPMVPMWVDEGHLAALLDGVRAVVVDVRTGDVGRTTTIGRTRASSGAGLPGADAGLEAYLRAAGLGADLTRARRMLEELEPQIGLIAYHHRLEREMVATDRLLAGEASRSIRRVVLRSIGVTQVAQDWLVGEHQGRVHESVGQVTVSPDGRRVAYNGPGAFRPGATSGFVVGVLDARTRRALTSPVPASATWLNWSRSSDLLVYTDVSQSGPLGFRGELQAMAVPGGAPRKLCSGENGYVVDIR